MEHLKTIRDKNGKDYQDLITRLNRIEGQVRGVKKMLEEDRYCVDILTQVSAVTCGLNAFNKKLLANHIKSCVVQRHPARGRFCSGRTVRNPAETDEMKKRQTACGN